jgi:hypothetical protein
MNDRLRVAITCLFLSGTVSMAAQLKSVPVDLQRGVFTAAVPFDEKFEITGTAEANVLKVTVAYTRLNRTSCRHGAAAAADPCNSAAANPVDAWARKGGSGAATFSLTAGPLAPNACYQFHFVQHVGPFAEDDRKKVREALSGRFRTLLAKAFENKALTSTEEAEIQNKINEAAREAVMTQFQACLANSKIDFTQNEINKVKLQVLALSATATDVAKNIETRREEVLKFFGLPSACANRDDHPAPMLRADLERLLDDPGELDSVAAGAWNAPVNPAREGHATTTMREVAQVVRDADHQTLRELLVGEQKIVGSHAGPSSPPDANSVALLSDFFEVYASQAFRWKTGEPVVPATEGGPLRGSLSDLAKKVRDEVQDKLSRSSTTELRRNEVFSYLCHPALCSAESDYPAPTLRAELQKLLADPSELSRGAADAWKSAVNPAREGHATTTMIHVARAIVAADDQAFADVITGKRKIAGTRFEPAIAPDSSSILLLADFFDTFSSEAFRRKTGSPVVDADLGKSLRFEVGQLARLVAEERQTRQDLEKTALPDFLAEKVLERGFDVSVSPTVITEGKNPYIGTDFGVGYAANVDKPFLYLGANFYRVPVNKAEEQLPYFGRDVFWKRASALVGLTTSGFDGNNIKNLFGAGNVMVGAGWRFNKYMKASGGAVIFKQKDANPVIDKDHFKATPFGSISFDVDLKQFLGGVSKLFGL